MIPKIKIADSYDGGGYIRDRYDGNCFKWVIDFTATYAARLGWPKLRLTWFFTATGREQWPQVEKQLITRAMKEQIVFIFIHKVYKPMTVELIEFIDRVNSRLTRERQAAYAGS